VLIRVDVSLTQEHVRERWIFARNRLLSFKPHDAEVLREDIHINVL